MAQKTEISLQSLLEDLAEDRRQAKALGQLSAAISATQLAAKLTGHLVERKEVGSAGDFAGLKSVAEIAQALTEVIGPEAAAAVQAALAPSEAAPGPVMELDSSPPGDENNLN